MTDIDHTGRASRVHSHPSFAGLRTHAEEPGVCALEDYICLTGDSFVMRSLRAQLRRVSPHFRVALITGEHGTCKETVALALHRVSADSDATFTSHSAASLLDLLPRLSAQIRSQFRKPGRPGEILATPARVPSPFPDSRFRSATSDTPLNLGGIGRTLFISGIGELSPGEQIHLRQSLQRIATARIGPERPRLIFATGRDLRGLSGAGHFDRKLYRLVSAVEILLPPLRSHAEDIPLITCALLARSATDARHSATAFDGRALSQLQNHDWPGNIRELERVVDLARPRDDEQLDGVIAAASLPALGEFTRHPPRDPIETRVERLDDVIHNHVLDVLLRCAGNKVRAAERLGISRSTLYRMLEAGAPRSEPAAVAPE